MSEFAHHRILLTNDDGVNAHGLKVLEGIARSLSDDIWIVAPELEQSGASHGLTLSQPLRVREIAPRHYAVQGTPTDCVMLAVHELMGEQKPTLLLSGVNRGANLAEDVTYSGTIAGAMEGLLCGIPSIAFSQVVGRHATPEHFATAVQHGPALVRDLLRAGWGKDVLINVNFPGVAPDDVKGIEVTRQGFRDESELVIDKREDARGFPYYWFGFRRNYGNPDAGIDLRAVRDGYISVTPLHLDLTQDRALAGLAQALEKKF
ncbi:5'/3'-nucleotidase SurE [Govanella unica]|uniref:5'-nucleotidase SurE n=1 Tax=Govanella unica TaxID=2975056 RepID=A0A9X3Z6V2_9PROT|nr:5'/3'-nucleotidase SurE [Govania unica]MDA5193324.1 5'/3'-nucleotidase SurE [Govania unica]